MPRKRKSKGLDWDLIITSLSKVDNNEKDYPYITEDILKRANQLWGSDFTLDECRSSVHGREISRTIAFCIMSYTASDNIRTLITSWALLTDVEDIDKYINKILEIMSKENKGRM